MPKVILVKSILTEYGISWAFCRSLYSMKLKLLNSVPGAWRLFEKNVHVNRIDIFNINTENISSFLKTIPQIKKNEIIVEANKALNGIIKGFSSIDLNYGRPIDWQLNPLTGKRCDPHTKWYKIPDFDYERGDIKIIWEASRLNHFFLFARAYMLTEDLKYYHAFSEQLSYWLKCNSYPNGANYKCGQECAIRMINALMSYSVFYSYGITSKSDATNISELVKCSYQKILSNFFYAHKCIKNNHTLSELCGMIIGAWCCEDRKKLEKAYSMIEKEILDQFSEDGGYCQFSFNYQRLALQVCECVISLSEITGRKLSRIAIDRIRNSALLLYQCQNDDGDVPNYGSNDGALIFPVSCCGYRDFRPTINAVYALTGGKQLYSEGLYREELLWFCVEKVNSTEIERKSSEYPCAGLYTLRNYDSFAMICLNDYQSRPAHFDQMHFDLWYKGANIFCDCGTYSYATELGKKLVRTEGHNTVKVDGVEQMNKYGSFFICNWSKASGITKTDTMLEGAMISKNGYIHKRCAVISEAGYTISDEVTAQNGFAVVFHTPLQVSMKDNLIILFDGSVPVCSVKSKDSNVRLVNGHQSLFYMKEKKITSIYLTPKSERIRNMITTIEFVKGNKND